MSDKRDLLDVLSNIVANARLVPDPSMNGTTDIYAVPCDDIEEAQRLLRAMSLPFAELAQCPFTFRGQQCQLKEGHNGGHIAEGHGI